MALVDCVPTLRLEKSLVYSVLYGLLMAIQTNVAKELLNSFEASYVILIRSISMVLTIPLIEWDATNDWTVIDMGLYIAACIVTFIPFATMAYSFQFIGVGDSTAIESGSSLIMTGILAHVLLDERISCSYLVLLLVSSGGVVMVARPRFLFDEPVDEDTTVRDIGVLLAFSGSFFLALSPVMVRKLNARRTLRCYIMTSMLGLVGIVLAGIWCTVESSWAVPTTWGRGSLLVIYGLANIFQVVIGFKLLEIAVAMDFSISMTLSIVISYVLQVTLFNEQPYIVPILGTVIVVTCFIISSSWDYLGTKVQEWFSHEIVPSDSEESELLACNEE